MPSSQPTGLPSSVPSSAPSSQPSSQPTQLPTAVALCPSLDLPHGSVNVVPANRAVGSVASFVCANGFFMSGASSALCDVPLKAPADLALHYSFDGSSANTGLTTATLTEVGMVSHATVAGVPAAAFDNPVAASTQSSNYLMATFDGGAPVSVALWIYTGLAFDSTVVGLVAAASPLLQLDVLASGQLRLRVAAPSVTLTSAAGAVAANTWVHVALTVDAASTCTMFVDGVAVASGAGTSGLGGYSSLVVGGSGDGARGFSGYVSDLRVYTRALDSIEMSAVAQREAQAATWSAAVPQCLGACVGNVSSSPCLSLCLSCLSVCLSVCMSVCPSVSLSLCLSVCLSARLSVCPSVCPSICLSIRPSVCLSVCPSVRLSVCLSIRPSVCLCA